MQPSLLRFTAGLSLAALPILSWLPAEDLLRTGFLSGHQEHFLAYMASGLLLATAVPRYRFVNVAIFYGLLAIVLEVGQIFVPGRHPEVVTAIISMTGAVAGEIAARLVTGLWRERYNFPSSILPRDRRAANEPSQLN
jgi:glycopeptide antibiotics resistance protein